MIYMDFSELGMMCLNRDLRGECQECLWWEMDTRLGCCRNYRNAICPIYRRQLYFADFYFSASLSLTVKGKLPSGGAG